MIRIVYIYTQGLSVDRFYRKNLMTTYIKEYIQLIINFVNYAEVCERHIGGNSGWFNPLLSRVQNIIIIIIIIIEYDSSTSFSVLIEPPTL